MLNSKIAMKLENKSMIGKVTCFALCPDETIAGTYDNNPLLNIIIYKVEFPDGKIKEYAANLIIKNMLKQFDSDGFSLTMMKQILDYCQDDSVAVSKKEMKV